MAYKCEYCGTEISNTDVKCPHCGAPNPSYSAEAALEARNAENSAEQDNSAPASNGKKKVRVPATIEELQQFCSDKKLPLDKLRFFIGENYQGAKAYGIYRDADGQVVVYKNKADGTRAVRYQGTDEAYAVNELYQKLKEETLKHKKPNVQSSSGSSASGKKKAGCVKVLSGCVIVGAAVMLISMICSTILPKIFPSLASPEQGYYYYDDAYYYWMDDWYMYDTGTSSWIYQEDVDSALENEYDQYYREFFYNDDFGITDFYESSYYDPSYYSSDDDTTDSDSGSSWFFDDDDDWYDSSDSSWDWYDSSDSSWDSGSDWDSDW